MPDLVEGSFYIQEDSESALFQVGIGLMVERWERNPNCSGGRRLLVSRTCLRRLVRIFSSIFPVMFSSEIGR
jgi:tmRNA-binding protein